MTTISCKLGPLEFGSGLPTMIILDYLRVFGEETKNDPGVVESLKRKDYRIMIERASKGLALLDSRVVDLCIDHKEIDVSVVLPELAMAVNEATGQALSLDTRNPEAIRRTLSIYPYKAILNSIPCEEEHIRNLMPLAAEYHAAVILMLTDDKGVPGTVDDRLRVAERLVKTAQTYGIPLEDLIIDTAVIAPATVEGAMAITLDTVRAVKQEFGCSTVLGIGNAGFGMPTQGLIIQAYLMAAMAAGVDAFLASYEDPVVPLLFPSKMAMDFLTNRDPYAKRFLKAYRANPAYFKNGTGSLIKQED
jgi:5-methyltetrahydrofolate--homocysteine methyltransferase